MLVNLPRTLLRLEGLALFGAALAVYLHLDYSVLALLLLFLAPDLSFVAFAAGPRVGAEVYDAVHTALWPLALGAAGVVVDEATLVQVALIWLAHIGLDRALGFGLRYPIEPQESHLDRV